VCLRVFFFRETKRLVSVLVWAEQRVAALQSLSADVREIVGKALAG